MEQNAIQPQSQQTNNQTYANFESYSFMRQVVPIVPIPPLPTACAYPMFPTYAAPQYCFSVPSAQQSQPEPYYEPIRVGDVFRVQNDDGESEFYCVVRPPTELDSLFVADVADFCTQKSLLVKDIAEYIGFAEIDVASLQRLVETHCRKDLISMRESAMQKSGSFIPGDIVCIKQSALCNDAHGNIMVRQFDAIAIVYASAKNGKGYYVMTEQNPRPIFTGKSNIINLIRHCKDAGDTIHEFNQSYCSATKSIIERHD